MMTLAFGYCTIYVWIKVANWQLNQSIQPNFLNSGPSYVKNSYFRMLGAATLAAGLLSACGGGSDTGSGPGFASLTGTAATGAAIAGAAVTAKCVVGTKSGVTNADGTFTLLLDGGQVAPCLLKVTKAGPPLLDLYGFAANTGNVNITPLTDLTINRALGASPATAFANFDTTLAANLSAGLTAASLYLQTQLLAVNLAAPPADYLTTPFTIGGIYDRWLDALGAALLGAGKTYADLVALTIAKGNLITLIPVQTPTAGTDIKLSPEYLALPFTGTLTYITDAAVLANFSGSHVFGRGVRHHVATVADGLVEPPSTIIGGCTVSVSGGNLILAAAGQQVSVSLTPSNYPTTTISRITASIFPRDALGDQSILRVVNNAANDSVTLTIANGYVTSAGSIDGTTGAQTECGTNSGGNQNTDRANDVLTLPAAFVSGVKAGAVAQGQFAAYSSPLTASSTTGLASAVNFGRGTLTKFNANFTVNTVSQVTDCKADIANGVLHVSSAAANFDVNYTLASVTYLLNSPRITLLATEAGVLGSRGLILIDVRTATPFVTNISATAGSNGNLLSCPGN